MAVSGVTGGTSIYGNRNVMSGLASGMDTESMIENMTKATRIKIAQQNQKKTLLGWKQTAYQGISSQLIEFSKKYMDFQSPTNLLSSSFYNQSIVTSVGKNSDLVSAIGKPNGDVTINGVKQLATAASHTAQGALQSQTLVTKGLDISGTVDYSKLAGETLTFEFGKEKYEITLDSEASLKTTQDVADEINRQLADTKLPKNETLGQKISVSKDGNAIKFEGTDKSGSTLKLVDVSSTAKDVLKIDVGTDGIDLAGQGTIYKTGDINESDLVQRKDTIDYLLNKTLTLSLNGQKKEITLLSQKDKDAIDAIKTGSADKNKKFIELLQGKLNDAFGINADGGQKITVNQDPNDNKITFNVAGDDPNDPSKSTNVLKVVNASEGLLGQDGVLGFNQGDGNRLNMESTLGSILGNKFPTTDADKKLTINGVDIKIENLGKDTTIGDVIRAINNNEELGLRATYSEITNQFTLTSKETGSGGKIDIKGSDTLAGLLFGETIVNGKQGALRGTDAVVNVTVNGQDKELIRPSNEIEIDGMKITISGKFGYDEATGALKSDPTEKVKFTAKPDTDKMFDAIKSMVEDYNKIVDSVYKEMTTKPNRDYKPLTDEQKKEMTKEQIEKWEEKAKEGLLFADTQLRSLHDSLRFVFNPGGEAGRVLRDMGIEPTKDYKDGGKIKLNEEKLRAALNADPEKVKNAFNALASEKPNSDSGIMNSVSKGGVMTQLKAVTDRFASTSITRPGVLVARAGNPASPNSMMKNALKTEIDSIDKYLKTLDTKLKKEVDRYNSKFTQLEMLISQMNAQSAQLAGFMGGGM